MPRLILVRHAQSANNVSSAAMRELHRGDLATLHRETQRARQPDPGLSPVGQAQLEPLARRLGPLAASAQTLLVSSPMQRALLTAAAIARAAELDRERFVCVGHLYEIGGCHHCGVAQPSTTPAAIEAAWPVRCEGVDPRGWYAGHDRMESAEEADARVGRAIDWARATLASERFATIIVVAHGDLLSRWLRRWLGVPTELGLAFPHANAALTTLDWHAEHGLQLRAFNDSAHLPPELHTGDETEAWWRYAEPDRARRLAEQAGRQLQPPMI